MILSLYQKFHTHFIQRKYTLAHVYGFFVSGALLLTLKCVLREASTNFCRKQAMLAISKSPNPYWEIGCSQCVNLNYSHSQCVNGFHQVNHFIVRALAGIQKRHHTIIFFDTPIIPIYSTKASSQNPRLPSGVIHA